MTSLSECCLEMRGWTVSVSGMSPGVVSELQSIPITYPQYDDKSIFLGCPDVLGAPGRQRTGSFWGYLLVTSVQLTEVHQQPRSACLE
jgi:hypothetical protein